MATLHNDKLIIKKPLDLPPIFIKQGDFPSFEQEVVRVVDKTAVKLWSIVHNPSDDAWILLLVLLLGEEKKSTGCLFHL